VKKKVSKILFLIFFISIQHIDGQTSTEVLREAENRAYSKDFSGADEILTAYTQSNTDLEVLRFHAQVLYWMEDFSRAEDLHEKIQEQYPGRNEVKLEYGRFLYHMGKIRHAEYVLKEFLQLDPHHSEANLLMANIHKWNGRLDKSRKIASNMAVTYPENEDFKVLLEDLKSLSAPVLGLSGFTYSDDQPLEYTGFSLQGSWYKSWFFSPKISFVNQKHSSFASDPFTSFIRAQNSIYLKSKTTITIGGGFFLPRFNNLEALYTAELNLSQKIFNSLRFDLAYEKKPYQYTNMSILDPFLFTTYKGSLNLESQGGFYGELGHQQQIFPDSNKINATYAWILIPLLNRQHFTLNAGYSFNFSNSKKSTFTIAETSGGQQAFPPVNNKPVQEKEGYYDLYFIPLNQEIHSILTSLKIGSERTNVTAKINAGLFASADAPYSETTSTVDFKNIKYSPFELETAFKLSLHKNLSLSGKYQYQKLFFFEAHTGIIGLTYQFL